MKIGILVPLPQELKSLTIKKIRVGACQQLTANIVVCGTGVGRKNTSYAIQHLLSQGVEHLISWGSAAGLSPELAGGDLLVPEVVKVSGKMFRTDNQFNDQFLSQIPAGIPVHRHPLCEAGGLLVSVDSKRQLFNESQCAAADMESGTLAEVATANQIPFSVIRSVSDPADIKLPAAVLRGFNSSGQFSIWQFLITASMNPGEWWLLIKLIRNFNKAQKTLNIAGRILKDW